MAGFEPWSRERGADVIARESAREGATLPILHALQGAFGYIHAEAILMIAEKASDLVLGRPPLSPIATT